jgi:Flp pilus assembly pilin Flp
MRRAAAFAREEKGATMVEFSLLAPLLFMLTFGVVDFGAVLYQFQAINTATAVAARMAATRGPLITGIPDCGVGTSGAPGTYCNQVAGAKTWAPVVCAGASPGAACNVVLMDRIVQEMQLYYPRLTRANLNIAYAPSGLGFIGLGKPVPAITVTITGLTADFIVMSAFGLNNIALPPFTTTLIAEDSSGA